MVEGRKLKPKGTGAGPLHPPPITGRQLRDSREFTVFKDGMKRLLAVPKSVLDERVHIAKETSPRGGNPKAAGRKRKPPDA